LHDPLDDRVEEGLGELGLTVLDQQADVEELCVAQRCVAQRGDVELALQAFDAFPDPVVVEANPLLERVL